MEISYHYPAPALLGLNTISATNMERAYVACLLHYPDARHRCTKVAMCAATSSGCVSGQMVGALGRSDHLAVGRSRSKTISL